MSDKKIISEEMAEREDFFKDYIKTDNMEKKDEILKPYSKNDSVLNDSWMLNTIMALLSGGQTKNPLDDVRERVTKLEAKEEIIEKIISK